MSMFARKALTADDKRAALVAALYSCRPHMLPSLTVDQLMARHGCDRKTTQYELMIAQQKRAGER